MTDTHPQHEMIAGVLKTLKDAAEAGYSRGVADEREGVAVYLEKIGHAQISDLIRKGMQAEGTEWQELQDEKSV